MSQCVGRILKIAFAAWIGSTLVAPSTGQEKPLKEPKAKKEKPLISKDEAILAAVAKKTFSVETERDRWLKVATEHFPQQTVADARGEIDFNRWFDAVSGGQPLWSLETIREKPIKELYLRAAQRLERNKEPISRAMFLEYAERNLVAGRSPPWKTPDPEKSPFDNAEKIFKMLDRNKSGVLEAEELSETLKPAAAHFDANGNGVMEYDEYREYFRARLTEYRDNPTALAVAPPPPPDEKPEPLPKKELPANLPKWFAELDDDRDGQVGLYEWRTIGQRPLDEFAEVDRDGDGLFTPYEMKCLLKAEPKSPYLKAKLPSIPSKFLRR